MAVASITECKKRFNRLLLLTDSYIDTLSNPPKRRSFNSDTEIADIILEADEILMSDVRNTLGHPYAPTFFADSASLVHGDKIPASDSPIHRVFWSTAAVALGTLTVQPGPTGTSATGLLTISGSATAATGRLTIPAPSAYGTGSLTFVEPMPARGDLTFVGTPTNGETIVVNGLTVTFRPAPPPGSSPLIATESPFTTDPVFNANALAKVLDASGAVQVTPASYSSLGNKVLITYDTVGTAGNAYTLANSSGGHVTRGSTTLTGGVDNIEDGESIYINGFPVVFLETAPAEVTSIEAPSIIYIQISADATTNANNLAIALNACTNTLISVATYEHAADSLEVSISYDQIGAIGNIYSLANSNADAIIASGSHLTGGVGGIVEGETITINGEVFTFSNFNTGTHFIPFDESSSVNVGEISDFLNASVIGAIAVATYGYVVLPDPGDGDAPGSSPYVTITYDAAGTAGNGYTLTNSSGGAITRSAATLTGGVVGIVEGETIVVNGVTFTFTNLSSGVTKIPFTASAQTNAVLMTGVLNASLNGSIIVATYSFYDSSNTSPTASYGTAITYLTHGTTGNSYTLANSSGGGVTRSASTLLGGVDDGGIVEGEVITVNGVLFTFTNLSFGATDIGFSSSINSNAAAISAKLTASVNALLTVATYSVSGAVVSIHGPANFTIADSSEDAVLASGATLVATWYDSEEGDRADIIEAVKALTAGNNAMFGNALQTYGYHDIVASELFTTSPFVKVVQAPWTRTTVCQSPMSYTTGIILLAISLAPKDGLDVSLLEFANKKATEFRQMIRSGAMILPEVVEFGLNEVSP